MNSELRQLVGDVIRSELDGDRADAALAHILLAWEILGYGPEKDDLALHRAASLVAGVIEAEGFEVGPQAQRRHKRLRVVDPG